MVFETVGSGRIYHTQLEIENQDVCLRVFDLFLVMTHYFDPFEVSMRVNLLFEQDLLRLILCMDVEHNQRLQSHLVLEPVFAAAARFPYQLDQFLQFFLLLVTGHLGRPLRLLFDSLLDFHSPSDLVDSEDDLLGPGKDPVSLLQGDKRSSTVSHMRPQRHSHLSLNICQPPF